MKVVVGKVQQISCGQTMHQFSANISSASDLDPHSACFLQHQSYTPKSAPKPDSSTPHKQRSPSVEYYTMSKSELSPELYHYIIIHNFSLAYCEVLPSFWFPVFKCFWFMPVPLLAIVSYIYCVMKLCTRILPLTDCSDCGVKEREARLGLTSFSPRL